MTRVDINPSIRSERSIKEEPNVSIIIPCKTIDVHTKKCVSYCLKMKYSNYEILVLPDFHEDLETVERLRIVPTGPIRPMSKRLIAGSMSIGSLCAFIDSDAFPTNNWLKNAIRYFDDSDVAAVVGPSLTSNGDDLMAKASGLILASPFGGGSESLRYSHLRSNIQYVTEAPACNLIIRKSTLQKVKDRILDVWPGEEIVLCGFLTNDLGKKIVYDPKVIVYHHRRPLFIPHLRQIWSYGFAKGFLFKSYYRYVKLRFLVPSFLVLGIGVGPFLAMINPIIMYAYISVLSTYVLLSFLNSVLIGVQQKSAKVIPPTFVGAIATHMCYGLAFIKGIFSKKL